MKKLLTLLLLPLVVFGGTENVSVDTSNGHVKVSQTGTGNVGKPLNFSDISVSGIGGGSTTFLGLTDTPNSYSGQGLKAVRVNVAANALEFYTPSGGGAVDSVFGRTGVVAAQSGDYTAAQVTNAVSTSGSYSNPSWITALVWSKITSTPTTLSGYGITDALSNIATPTLFSSGDTDDVVAHPYTADNSGLIVKDANNVEVFRMWASDPDPTFTNWNNANLYIGYQSGLTQPHDQVSAGGYNTGVGYQTLSAITTGYANTALGAFAILDNTIGSNNTAVGEESLKHNTSGIENVALGDGSLANLTTGQFNTGVGHAALYDLVSGSDCVAVGRHAGYTVNAADSGDVYIGNFTTHAAATSGAISNGIALGTSVVIESSNTAVIGNSSVTDVYFGSTSGLATLHGVGSSLSGVVPTSRTLTIAGTALDLSANRSWTQDTITGLSTTGLVKRTAANTLSTITDNSSNWDTAFTDRLKWDGGATGLTASTGRTSLGATTVGSNIFTLTNPSAITWIEIAADNTVSTKTASQMRTDLSLVPGTDVQVFDADLTTIAGLTATTDNFMVSVASNWASRTPSQVRTTLGLVIGTNVQAWDADLDTWATITPGTGVGTFLATPSSANLKSAITDETGSGGALVFATSPTLTTPDFTTGFTIGTTAASGKIPVGNGTNYVASTPTFPNASATSGKVIKSDGTNWVASTETYAVPGTSGNVLTSDGTNWTSAASSGGATGANPTAKVGVSVVNGSASTFMRSDAAPPIDQTVNLAMTALQTIKYSDSSTGNTPAILTLTHNSSATPITNFGTELDFNAKDSTTADTQIGSLVWQWSTASHATRASKLSIFLCEAGSFTNEIIFTGVGGLSLGTGSTPVAGVIDLSSGVLINGAATSGKLLQGDGSKYGPSTPTWPTTASTSNKVVQSNGTNFLSQFLKGTTTNDNAASGEVGEEIQSLVASGSAVSLTTATAANVTSISLTAGDWDVEGNVNFTETTSTVTARSAGVSTTSATVPSDGSEAYCGVQSTVTSETNTITLPTKRVSLSGTTTTYLVAKATFSAGTCAGFGAIIARRVR